MGPCSASTQQFLSCLGCTQTNDAAAATDSCIALFARQHKHTYAALSQADTYTSIPLQKEQQFSISNALAIIQAKPAYQATACSANKQTCTPHITPPGEHSPKKEAVWLQKELQQFLRAHGETSHHQTAAAPHRALAASAAAGATGPAGAQKPVLD
jgi:hypothetical protein